MLLQNKNAVIYGGGGSLAGAVARVMAGEGANIFLAGRNIASLQQVREEIIRNGGKARVAEVNTMDKNSVDTHMSSVAAAGSVDISFNLTGIYNVQNIDLVDMSLNDFAQPVHETMITQFLTATAAARVMPAIWA